jgi:bifunctional enzyme CysN/CysC
MTAREQMNIVVVGHVDHGKSTVIGRLLADTGSLPQGKLERVKEQCARNARPFEYAFLLDALKDEQAQGITIDTARCFFKSEKREYIIIDAPGHIEFLRNMVSGAARAEAALLVIDAHEGIAENSRRHGYLVSMLGIRRIIVLVNKMDLVNFDPEVFGRVCSDYRSFLSRLGVEPHAFIPVCARDGDNLAVRSAAMPWYEGDTVLAVVDGLEKKADDANKPLRLPVQDIYKFTGDGDDRRIFAGTVESGTLAVGDDVVFYPSGKHSRVASIEAFNRPPAHKVSVGEATGVTLSDELYIRRGEIMCKAGEAAPAVASRFVASVFWMGRAPLVTNKKYKLKIGTAAAQVRLAEILVSIDATDLSSCSGKQQLDRHDVAECVFETMKPVAFDTVAAIEPTGRFVIIDNYDIAGGGIILRADSADRSWVGEQVRNREIAWEHGYVSSDLRAARNGHQSRCVVVFGDSRREEIARVLERSLFNAGFQSYFLGIGSVRSTFDTDNGEHGGGAEQLVQRVGEISRIITDAGVIFVTALGDMDPADLGIIRKLNEPFPILSIELTGEETTESGADMVLGPSMDTAASVKKIVYRLCEERILPDYSI